MIFSNLRFLSICFFLPSCTLAVPQLDGLLSILGDAEAVKATNPNTNLQWTAQVNGTGRLMNLYALEAGGFIFVSEEGDLINFDGWVVTMVKGFNLPERTSIQDTGNTRTISERKRLDVVLRCDDWRAVISEGQKRWKQTCGGLSEDNEIVLGESGDVIQIQQVISSAGSKVLLRKIM